jgi:hypothetical protein
MDNKIDHAKFPLATKLRIPRGGWPSHCSEYDVAGEPNRWRYVHESYQVVDNPAPTSLNGLRRLFCRVEGRRGVAIQLFEELPNRPR